MERARARAAGAQRAEPLTQTDASTPQGPSQGGAGAAGLPRAPRGPDPSSELPPRQKAARSPSGAAKIKPRRPKHNYKQQPGPIARRAAGDVARFSPAAAKSFWVGQKWVVLAHAFPGGVRGELGVFGIPKYPLSSAGTCFSLLAETAFDTASADLQSAKFRVVSVRAQARAQAPDHTSQACASPSAIRACRTAPVTFLSSPTSRPTPLALFPTPFPPRLRSDSFSPRPLPPQRHFPPPIYLPNPRASTTQGKVNGKGPSCRTTRL